MIGYSGNRARDEELILHERSVLTPAGTFVGQKDGSAQVIDLGDGVKDFGLVAAINIHAIAATQGQRYEVSVQGSKTPNFAAFNIGLGTMVFGDPSQIALNDVATELGRYLMPLRNYFDREGNPSTVEEFYTPFRYVRATVYVPAGSAGTPSLDLSIDLIRE